MITLQGKGVFKSIAIGKLSFYNRSTQQIKRYHVNDTENEIKRFENAKEKAIDELKTLYDKALQEVGETHAMIFEVHQMMLSDLDYIESIINIINMQNVNAEYAVGTTADNFAEMFSSMDDEYMKERAADVKDVSERIVKILQNAQEASITGNEPVIIAADDLAPSETVQLDKDKVLGFVTMYGSSNSHTAILARTMNIPAVIGIGDSLKNEYNGKLAIVDGFTGTIYIEPDENTLNNLQEKKKKEDEKVLLLQQLKGKENITKDGQKIKLYANIGNIANLGAALQNDAGGIGLFRSEFIYLESNDFPTEDEQFAIYKSVAEKMSGKKAIIRTLDIGADKQADYFNLPKEENPALGYRAIRICLKQPEIFKTQLRALYRASAFGNIAIMIPMITSLSEVLQVKEIVKQIKQELENDKIPYSKNVELGIMIETPAAAIISDVLAKEVDFFSIGTNDLTQYTLAIDRQNENLDSFCDTHHLAILRLIKLVADNAHANGIWMGICGELAADLDLTETFLAMGIDELSVSPGFILGLRNKIRSTNVAEIKNNILEKIIPPRY